MKHSTLRQPRPVHMKRSIALVTFLLLFSRSVFSGSGVVNNDGTIDITVNFNFPPTASDITDIQNGITDASHVLWDASEGQLRFGDVTVRCSNVNADLADMRLMPQTGRSYASANCEATVMATAGKRVTLFADDWDGNTIAHEFAHLALGIRDEYGEDSKCIGPCIESANWTDQTANLMQSSSGGSEFCTDDVHDLVQGDGINCPEGDSDYCCESWSSVTSDYETARETLKCDSTSVWSHLVANFPFLVAPVGLPQAAEPGGFVDPVFIDECNGTDTVLLVLDRSGSMAWSSDDEVLEVCDNGVDDDLDGDVDEDECEESRLEYLQAAARGWLDLAVGQGVRAGIISFDCLPSLDEAFQDVDAASATTMQATVDGLVADGSTGIGNALVTSAAILGAEAGAVNKTVFLITDGYETCESDPESRIPLLNAEGIRVFTIGTGEAADTDDLETIAGETGGAPLHADDPSTLVNAFVQQFGRYRGNGIAIPLLPYEASSLEQTGAPPLTHHDGQQDITTQTAFDWSDPKALLNRNGNARKDILSFLVEKGTSSFVVALAGKIAPKDGFGVTAKLVGPVGANPNTFDTQVPSPFLRVVKDSFFVMIELRDPNPGQWAIGIESAVGAAGFQTGNATVLIDNPNTELVTDLTKRVLTGPGDSTELSLSPTYYTALDGVSDVQATLVRPDGSVVPLTVDAGSDEFEGYESLVAGDIPFQGIYEIRTRVRTRGTASNHPGESLFSHSPDNSVVVPDLERTASEFFFVSTGEKVCASGNQNDCDGDGVEGESRTEDSDGDGVPDDCDRDSDNDEIPDRVEWKGKPTDMDKDGTPDHLDSDADGDGIHDSVDPNISLGDPTHEIEIDPVELSPCGETCFYVRVSSEEPLKGLQVGLTWGLVDGKGIGVVGSGMEIVSVEPGPDVTGKLSFFDAAVEKAEVGLGAGEAVIGLALDATDAENVIAAGSNRRVLKICVRVRPEAKIGRVVRLCVADGLGSPAKDTTLSVLRGNGVASVSPTRGCVDFVVTGDTTPPVVTCPADIIVPCAGSDGAVVKYEASAVDDCGKVEVEYFPPSGSVFPPGVHVVVCRSVDSSGNVGQGSFLVRVGDIYPPVIECPADIEIPCAGPDGAPVEWQTQAEDACGDVTVSCDPPSGSFFPPGVTEVKCTATDTSGNVAVCFFRVHVGNEKCFKRSDVNADSTVDITDGISGLKYLFQGGVAPVCLDALDANDDGKTDITDPLGIFTYLFRGGAEPPVPGPFVCGPDPTEDALADCEYPVTLCD